MSDLNRVVIIGRLTRDGELKYTNGGTACLNLGVACGRTLPPREGSTEWKTETSFFDATAWGKLAESKHPHMTKGKLIGIEGRLQQDRWEQDGQQRSKVYIVAESIQVLADPKGSASPQDSGQASAPPESATRAAPASRPASRKPAAPAEEFEDDIPF